MSREIVAGSAMTGVRPNGPVPISATAGNCWPAGDVTVTLRLVPGLTTELLTVMASGGLSWDASLASEVPETRAMAVRAVATNRACMGDGMGERARCVHSGATAGPGCWPTACRRCSTASRADSRVALHNSWLKVTLSTCRDAGRPAVCER